MTTNKWKQYSDNAPKGGGGLFVRLQANDSIKFIVTGEPHESHKLFEGGKPKDVKPGTKDASVKIMLAVFDVDAKSSRVLNLTPNTFATLADKLGEFGDDHVFRIKRTGAGMTDTRYHIDHIGNAAQELLDQALGEDPIDLEQYGGIPISLGAEEPTPEPAPAKPLTARRQGTPKQADPEPEADGDIPF